MKNFRANVVLTPATVVLCLIVLAPIACAQGGKFEREVRARDLGVPFEGTPGPLDAITDVKGVEVGYRTLISGDGKLVVGTGPVRTGVTAVFPAREEFGGSGLCGMVHGKWQWRDDRHNLGGRIRISLRAGDDYEYAQRRSGARCRDRLAIAARSFAASGRLVVAARGGGDVGRLSERHQRISREGGRRGRSDARRARQGRSLKATWVAGRG